jgi:hypothetical protein
MESFKESKTLGGDIAQECLEVVEVHSLNRLIRKDSLVELPKDLGGFLVGFSPTLNLNLQISHGVLSSF